MHKAKKGDKLKPDLKKSRISISDKDKSSNSKDSSQNILRDKIVFPISVLLKKDFKKSSHLEEEVQEAEKEISAPFAENSASLFNPTPAISPQASINRRQVQQTEQEPDAPQKTERTSVQSVAYAPPASAYSPSNSSRRTRAYESAQEQMTRLHALPSIKPLIHQTNSSTEQNFIESSRDNSIIQNPSHDELSPSNKSRYYYRPQTISEDNQPKRRRTDFF